ncbi:uncharacterized protein V1518DRAFT_411635 [Limtongia smithiae]|uniref:uncharacterized protein n=1 Tax=Limtongia smithiae TaxID=1125753 RepID=UPI0034CDAFE2
MRALPARYRVLQLRLLPRGLHTTTWPSSSSILATQQPLQLQPSPTTVLKFLRSTAVPRCTHSTSSLFPAARRGDKNNDSSDKDASNSEYQTNNSSVDDEIAAAFAAKHRANNANDAADDEPASFSKDSTEIISDESAPFDPDYPTEEEIAKANLPTNLDVYFVRFTCRGCDTRSGHFIARQAYHDGTVIAFCPGCDSGHIFVDNLNVFPPGEVEDIALAEVMSLTSDSIALGNRAYQRDGVIEIRPPGPMGLEEFEEYVKEQHMEEDLIDHGANIEEYLKTLDEEDANIMRAKIMEMQEESESMTRSTDNYNEGFAIPGFEQMKMDDEEYEEYEEQNDLADDEEDQELGDLTEEEYRELRKRVGDSQGSLNVPFSDDLSGTEYSRYLNEDDEEEIDEYDGGLEMLGEDELEDLEEGDDVQLNEPRFTVFDAPDGQDAQSVQQKLMSMSDDGLRELFKSELEKYKQERSLQFDEVDMADTSASRFREQCNDDDEDDDGVAYFTEGPDGPSWDDLADEPEEFWGIKESAESNSSSTQNKR